LIVVATLRSALGRPVFAADNVRVTATGALRDTAVGRVATRSTYESHVDQLYQQSSSSSSCSSNTQCNMHEVAFNSSLHTCCCPLADLPAGNISGAITVPPLALQPDNTWTLRFTLQREETLTLKMTVDSQAAGTQLITISGRSLSFLALNASLQQASLVSQGLAATSLITEGALLMVYLEESSYAYVPVVDKAGTR
jgi:hypothetical protein